PRVPTCSESLLSLFFPLLSCTIRRPPTSTLFPYTTLFRSRRPRPRRTAAPAPAARRGGLPDRRPAVLRRGQPPGQPARPVLREAEGAGPAHAPGAGDRRQRRARAAQAGPALPARGQRAGAVGTAGAAQPRHRPDGPARRRRRPAPGLGLRPGGAAGAVHRRRQGLSATTRAARGTMAACRPDPSSPH